MIFKEGTSFHLGIARVLIYSILLVDLLVDDLPALASMPSEAFLPRGVLLLLPESWLDIILQVAFLKLFSLLYGLILLLGLCGLGHARLITGLALISTILFHGLARGFGGHVNHQELIVLHSLFFLLSNGSFAALSLNSFIWKKSPTNSDDETSRLLLRALCFWILLTYFFIGMARLQTSDWRVYGTNAMTAYSLQHSIKWNYWDFSFARHLLDRPAFNLMLTIAFPLATLLEIAAPLCVFLRKLVWPIVVSLWLFHMSILLCMNIFFWQNMLLLFIPIIGWYADRKWEPTTESGKPIFVFYDAACGLCDGFIRHIAKIDKADLIRLAPLDGQTAREKNLKLPEIRGKWTIIVFDGDRVLDRSDAILYILKKTNTWADFSDLAGIIPKSLRDTVYRIIARWRHLIPMRKDTCEIPSPELRRKLLP